MTILRKVGLFFIVLFRSLWRAWSDDLSREKINIGEYIYFRLPKDKATMKGDLSLISLNADDVQSNKLSVSDATQLFHSIKRACDLQDVVEVKVGDLSWKTDARLKSDPALMTVVFNGPGGYTHATVKRNDVTEAILAFANKFGVTYS